MSVIENFVCPTTISEDRDTIFPLEQQQQQNSVELSFLVSKYLWALSQNTSSANITISGATRLAQPAH